MSPLRIRRIDAIRGGIAGSRAVGLRAAAIALFEAGGQRVLPAVVQRAVRGTVEREASRVLASVGVVERTLEASAAQTVSGARTAAVVVRGARAASRQILRGVGAAAVAGAVVDGGVALLHAVRHVRAGKMNRQQAAMHVAREAGTGAAATAAGTAAAAVVIAMTGGVATPAVFVVAAAASVGAKMGLDAWITRRRERAEPPALLTQGSTGS